MVAYMKGFIKNNECKYSNKKIHDNNKIDEFNFYKYGSLPILFITARNYRIPLPSNIIYKFLEENNKE